MGKEWDCSFEKQPDWIREAYRVLKPKGIIKAFSGTRTFHRSVLAMKRVGFVNISINAWFYLNGFPKSYCISKQIDKDLGLEREVTGTTTYVGAFRQEYQVAQGYRPNNNQGGYLGEREGAFLREKPASQKSAQWCGWASCLKPSFEPIIVGYKE